MRNLKDNKYNSLVLTFQIGLHIDDLYLLKLIQSKLNCGHISISGSRCNYFVNDRASLINVILPIFNYVQLSSSKFFQFLTFEKAVNIIKNKDHLSPKGKLEIIKCYYEMKNVNITSRSRSNICISDYWLGGFTDGDGSFSSNKHVPRLKFENHEKEFELFKSIKEYLNAGNLTIVPGRKNVLTSNPMVVLEINAIHVLKNVIIPSGRARPPFFPLAPNTPQTTSGLRKPWAYEEFSMKTGISASSLFSTKKVKKSAKLHR